MYRSNVESGYGPDERYSFSEKSIRQAFIRKVYGILTCQIAVTVAIVAIFTFHEPTKQYVQEHPALWWLALITMIVTLVVLACCGNTRRTPPMNYICLGVFTLAEGFLLGCFTSLYKREEVFYAAVITLVVTVALTVFAFQTKVDFTVFGGILFVAVIILRYISQ